MPISLDRATRPRILVVDDEPVFLAQVQECLHRSNYDVVLARNGREAIASLDKGHFDLILLDIIMPVLNGVEVTKILRRNPLTRDIPIIVVSTMTEYKDRVEFFRIGANDYMPKPIDNGELLARVDLQLQVLRLRSEVELANDALKQKNRMLEQHLARIEHDLAVARSVQRALLPAHAHHFDELSVFYQQLSCENLGSDFVDYLRSDDGTIHIILADVSGHGIASALLAAQLKVLFLSICLPGRTAAQVMDEINLLSSHVLIEGYYFTAVYMQYRPAAGTLAIVNGGHQPMLFFEQASGKIKQVESSNAPIGFFAEEKYQQVVLQPKPGDLVLLYTDGITEHTNSAGEMFGVKNVIQTFRSSVELSSTDLINILLRKARDFGNSPVFADDVTIALVKFLSANEPQSESHVSDEAEIESIRPVR